MSVITITDQQAKNTRVAYAVMAGIPSKRINLDVVRKGDLDDKEFIAPSCNSGACLAGWLSAHPHFVAQGLYWDAKVHEVHLQKGTHKMRGLLNQSKHLFGRACNYDSMFSMSRLRMGQKKEVLQRLREHLLNAGRITKERNSELIKYEKTVC